MKKWIPLFLLLSLRLEAQVVLSEVLFDPEGIDTARQVVEIRNLGGMPASIGGYWLSFKPAAWQFPPQAVIPPGGVVLVHVNRSGPGTGEQFYTGTSGMRNLRRGDGLSLFRRNLFSDPSVLVDFVEWGAPGVAGEDVAVEAGRWIAGETVPVSALREGSTIAYDGAGRSAAAWCIDGSPTLGDPNDDCTVSRSKSPMRLNEVKPGAGSMVELVNAAQVFEELDGKWLLSKTSAYRCPAGTIVLPGKILLVHLGSSGVDTGEELYTGPEFPVLDASDSIALYAGPDGSDLTLILDFVQWGSPGMPFEAQAAAAGLWPAGEAVGIDGLSRSGSVALSPQGVGPARWKVDNTPTPGTDNQAPPPSKVLLNEVLMSIGSGGAQAVEILNRGPSTADLSDWNLCTRSALRPDEVACLSLPQGAILEPGRLLLVELGPEEGPGEEGRFPFPLLNPRGGELAFLVAPGVEDPSNFQDYLRWGEGGPLLEAAASAAGLWTMGEAIEVSGLVDGSSLAYNGPGRGPASYRIDLTPSPGLSNEERPVERDFIRSDCNQDGTADISDPIGLFSFLFAAAEVPPCEDACDSNDDGATDISDPIHLMGFLFLGATPRPPRKCGPDETADGLTCLSFPFCMP